MRLARQRPAVRHFQVTLRALQRLDRWLLVDGEDQSVLGRLHVKADHRGRLGGERGIVALAPALAGGKINLVSAQEAPDILHPDVAEGRGDQRPGPARIAGGNWLIERRQNTLVVGLRIFWIIAALAGFVEAAKPALGVAHPPFRRCPRRAANRPADGPRRQTIRRQKYDPRPLPKPVFGPCRARQALKLGPLLIRQCDRRSPQGCSSCTHESRLTHQRKWVPGRKALKPKHGTCGWIVFRSRKWLILQGTRLAKEGI